MKARFIGKSSCGFIHGHSYCIYSRIRDDRLIWIYDKNSKAQCPYQSLESFFANWKYEPCTTSSDLNFRI